MPYAQTCVDRIQQARSSRELDKLWQEISRSTFLNIVVVLVVVKRRLSADQLEEELLKLTLPQDIPPGTYVSGRAKTG